MSANKNVVPYSHSAEENRGQLLSRYKNAFDLQVYQNIDQRNARNLANIAGQISADGVYPSVVLPANGASRRNNRRTNGNNSGRNSQNFRPNDKNNNTKNSRPNANGRPNHNSKSRRTAVCIAVLPLQMQACLARQENSNSAYYRFPIDSMHLNDVFGRRSPHSDLFAGQLQIDLGSITCDACHVARVAGIFNRVLSEHAAEIPQQNFYFSVGCYTNQRDLADGDELRAFLGANSNTCFLYAVPEEEHSEFGVGYLRRMLQEIFRVCQLELPTPPTLQLSPDNIIIVRRFQQDTDPLQIVPQGVAEFALPHVEVSEMRLIYSRGGRECPSSASMVDPRFSEPVGCRPILRDDTGSLARHEFGRMLQTPVLLTEEQQGLDDQQLRQLVMGLPNLRKCCNWYICVMFSASLARTLVKNKRDFHVIEEAEARGIIPPGQLTGELISSFKAVQWELRQRQFDAMLVLMQDLELALRDIGAGDHYQQLNFH